MTRAVLSIGSNLGDRLARLRSVVDALGDRLVTASPIYETPPWGYLEQGPFLNAVVIAEDESLDARGWLRFGQDLERAADRVRGEKWGPRTLDVDLVQVLDRGTEVLSWGDGLILPHPLAHLRAFVVIPWLAADPGALLTVIGVVAPVSRLVAELDAGDRAGVRQTDLRFT